MPARKEDRRPEWLSRSREGQASSSEGKSRGVPRARLQIDDRPPN
jgi:hypothetical protein